MLPRLILLAGAATFAHAASSSPGSVYVSTKANTGCTSGDAQSVAPGKCIRANTVQAPAPGFFDPDAFHEYAIKKFPNCPNGRRAVFVLYEDATCRRELRTIGNTDRPETCQQVSDEFRSASFDCPNIIGAGDDGDTSPTTAETTATSASNAAASMSSTASSASASSSAASNSTASSQASATATTATTGTAGSATAAASASSTGAATFLAVPVEWVGCVAAVAALI